MQIVIRQPAFANKIILASPLAKKKRSSFLVLGFHVKGKSGYYAGLVAGRI